MIDLHTHTILSDGELLPSELVRRALVKGYTAIAITDHADLSNIDFIVPRIVKVSKNLSKNWPIKVIPGIEITHVPKREIKSLVRVGRSLGAKIIIVHGETIVEPVAPGTNAAAVSCPDVDILAHPGMLTVEEARLAAANDVYIEITSRGGHSLSNGHVARVARAAGARLVVNTDAHQPGDMIDQAMAQLVAAAAGLDQDEVEAATVDHPQEIVRRMQARHAVLRGD